MADHCTLCRNCAQPDTEVAAVLHSASHPGPGDSPQLPQFAGTVAVRGASQRVTTTALWIHGHTHHTVDDRSGPTRVVSNQRGYPDEPAEGFDPALVVEV